MTDEKSALRTLLEKGSDATFLREMIGFAAQRVMELESCCRRGSEACPALPGASSPHPAPCRRCDRVPTNLKFHNNAENSANSSYILAEAPRRGWNGKHVIYCRSRLVRRRRRRSHDRYANLARAASFTAGHVPPSAGRQWANLLPGVREGRRGASIPQCIRRKAIRSEPEASAA